MIVRDGKFGIDRLLGSTRVRGKMALPQGTGGDAEIGGCGAIEPYGIRRRECVSTPSPWQALSLTDEAR